MLGSLPQGRLPEIQELQRQISAAHEELSDAAFKANEDRSAAAAREQRLSDEQARLERAVAALTEANARLEREAAAAATHTAHQEQQLNELYELCTSQQGRCELPVSMYDRLNVVKL